MSSSLIFEYSLLLEDLREVPIVVIISPQLELGRMRKTTLDFGGESRDKISALTKEQKEIIEKL